LIACREQPDGIPPERMLRQQPRVEIGFDLRDARLSQALPSRGDAIVDGRQLFRVSD
jgi:hypothetical protein